MFGGKIAGLNVESIGKISGANAQGLFNFGGANTKYYYMVQVTGYRSGSFTDNSNSRVYIVPLGWTLYRKINANYGTLLGGNAWNVSHFIRYDSGSSEYHTGNSRFYVKDVHVTVTPTRSKTYQQYNSNGGSETPTAYHINAISGDTQFP